MLPKLAQVASRPRLTRVDTTSELHRPHHRLATMRGGHPHLYLQETTTAVERHHLRHQCTHTQAGLRRLHHQ